ncbi:uncharacterized protein LOC143857533 isoform X2 [Tasmannia lanceolata]|uniref:uncharacterized protein LOC143857533 isoform X2 n=1 Tax=Tasmannia lanceolata TaxID=3420 RepID=UPI0040643D98
MAVYDWLVDYLDRVSKGGRYLGGCSLVIQLWLYEHTTFWIPTKLSTRPRVLKWDWKAKESKTYRSVEQKKIKKLKDRVGNFQRSLRYYVSLENRKHDTQSVLFHQIEALKYVVIIEVILGFNYPPDVVLATKKEFLSWKTLLQMLQLER